MFIENLIGKVYIEVGQFCYYVPIGIVTGLSDFLICDSYHLDDKHLAPVHSGYMHKGVHYDSCIKYNCIPKDDIVLINLNSYITYETFEENENPYNNNKVIKDSFVNGNYINKDTLHVLKTHDLSSFLSSKSGSQIYFSSSEHIEKPNGDKKLIACDNNIISYVSFNKDLYKSYKNTSATLSTISLSKIDTMVIEKKTRSEDFDLYKSIYCKIFNLEKFQ